MKRLFYLILAIFILNSCAGPLSVVQSTSQKIIPGRPGAEKSIIYTFTLKNNKAHPMELTKVAISIDNRYYALPFDVFNEKNETLESIPAHATVTVKAKFHSSSAKIYNDDQMAAALIFYKQNGKIKTIPINNISILESKRLR